MDANCHVQPVQKISTPEERQGIATACLNVWGMGCPNCANRVHNRLVALNGIISAVVDHSSGLAVVNYNPALVSMQSLLDAVSQGDGPHKYTATLLKEL